jgi:lipopolysaccharide export system protein LptA
MSKRRSRAALVPLALAGSASLALAIVLATAGLAQTMTNTFGGLSQSSKDPIDIESDVLVVHDSQKYATFKGNVKAVQGTTTLRAQQLDVHYVGGGDKLTGVGKSTPAEDAAGTKGDSKGDAGKGTQITKIEAKGAVVITSEDDQTTTSDWALYDVPSQTVTVAGNVVLTQGQNVLKGDRLFIDLKTGESRFENTANTAAGGRIRALFMPKDGPAEEKSGDKSDDGKPRDLSAPGEAAPDAAAAGANAPAEARASGADGNGQPGGNQPWQLVPEVGQ